MVRFLLVSWLMPCTIVLPVATKPLQDFSNHHFRDYLEEYGKSYIEDGERAMRERIFDTNREMVLNHNSEFAQGLHSWWMELNGFSDRTPEEITSRLGRIRKLAAAKVVVDPTKGPLSRNRTPLSFDWRDKNAVTAVKDQGSCGSCWAFSATETMESMHAIYNGELVELAPQAFVSCVKNPDQCGGIGGCGGDIPEAAFNFTADMGMPLESALPYKAKDEKCIAYTPVVKATGYASLPANNAQALESALAQIGPMSVNVAAGPWMGYGGGIFDGCSKSGQSVILDHVVQAVGYAKDYWIVRNSWGVGWGEKGYIRLSRSADDKTFKDTTPASGVACKPYPAFQMVGGECGILFDMSYPTGVHKAEAIIDMVVL